MGRSPGFPHAIFKFTVTKVVLVTIIIAGLINLPTYFLWRRRNSAKEDQPGPVISPTDQYAVPPNVFYGYDGPANDQVPPNVYYDYSDRRGEGNGDPNDTGMSEYYANLPTDQEILLDTLQLLNKFGKKNLSTSIPALSKILMDGPINLNLSVITHALSVYHNLNNYKVNKYLKNRKYFGDPKENITVGVIACGERLGQFYVWIKTAVMFTLDANLHIVAFSDKDAILDLGAHILGLKLALDKVGHNGLTFEIHLEWYPQVKGNPDWKNMYRKCATQRLFFPSILKHHDALIYLDTDALVLSNLTEMWHVFKTQMKSDYMMGITPNSETANVYHPGNAMPHYEPHGINAGIMLMNLTQLREFEFEARAKAIHTAYKERIWLADQDIINGVYRGHPNAVLNIGCTFNFYWLHCIQGFCSEVLKNGVRILHGNYDTFTKTDGIFHEEARMNMPFIKNTYDALGSFDLYTDSYLKLFQKLSNRFYVSKSVNCSNLTSSLLYGRASAYFRNLDEMLLKPKLAVQLDL